MFVSLRTEPLKKDTLKSVTGHNHRVKEFVENEPKIDPKRTHLNQHLIKTAENVEEAVQGRLDGAKAKPPKHSTYTAQELVLSASPEYFRPEYHRDDPDGWGKYDEARMEKWKEKTMEWLEKEYGKKNIVDAVLHLDEATPHIHAVVVPIAEVTLKKRMTKEQKENKEEQKTYTKEKYKRTHFFDQPCLKRIQEEYGSHMNGLGLYRGIPKSLTKKKHKETKEWHRERFLKTKTPFNIESPEMRFKMETSIEGFQFPEPKFFESAKKYKERIEEQANHLIEEQLGDEYSERIRQYEESFQTLKEYTEDLYDELIEEREQNKHLMKAMNRFVEVNTRLFENSKDKELAISALEEIRDKIIEQEVQEEELVNEEKPSDRIEGEKKEFKIKKTKLSTPKPS